MVERVTSVLSVLKQQLLYNIVDKMIKLLVFPNEIKLRHWN